MKEAYLYRIHDDRLLVYKGCLSQTEYPSNLKYSKFKQDAVPNSKRFCTRIINHEGAIYNKCLWLSDRDDNKAKLIFEKYLEDLIDSYRKHIYRNNKIKSGLTASIMEVGCR